MALLDHSYQITHPTIDGCKSCGGCTIDCQCIKFDAQTERDGSSMDDLVRQNLLSAFSLYGQVSPPSFINDARQSENGI